jgi:CheY-like chemotaxis protein
MAHILMIDDDEVLRATIRRVLERAGHRVTEAENGDVGMRIVQGETPDLVITDLLMPEKEGIETIQELREGFPEIPIVAVSGAGGEPHDQGRRHGVTAAPPGESVFWR